MAAGYTAINVFSGMNGGVFSDTASAMIGEMTSGSAGGAGHSGTRGNCPEQQKGYRR